MTGGRARDASPRWADEDEDDSDELTGSQRRWSNRFRKENRFEVEPWFWRATAELLKSIQDCWLIIIGRVFILILKAAQRLISAGRTYFLSLIEAGATLWLSAAVQLLSHSAAPDPHLHETTLSRCMNQSAAGRYGQNVFLNGGFLYPFQLFLSAFFLFNFSWWKRSFHYLFHCFLMLHHQGKHCHHALCFTYNIYI